VQTIGQIGPDAAPAIPELTKLLGDPNEQLCEAAAEALGRIGREAREAVPKLIELLDSEQWTVARAVLEALESITGERLGKAPGPWRQWWEARQ
jgi:HEAT repeat protein